MLGLFVAVSMAVCFIGWAIIFGILGRLVSEMNKADKELEDGG